MRAALALLLVAAGQVVLADSALAQTPTVSLVDPSAPVVEGDVLLFEAVISPAPTGEVTATLATAAGTATDVEGDRDYYSRPNPPTITFGPSTTTVQVEVFTLNDLKREGDESMQLLLTSVTGAVIGDETAVGRIQDDGDTCDIVGTTGFDTLVGTPKAEKICGGAGSDTIKGFGGDDVIIGDDGRDQLYGGAGNDHVSGGAGDDGLWGNDGNDVLKSDGGNDWVRGGPGNDRMSAGFGDFDRLAYDGAQVSVTVSLELSGALKQPQDTGVGKDVLLDRGFEILIGGPQADSLTGRDGENDQIHGQAGNDTLNGLAGNDLLVGQAGIDACNGGSGTGDTADSTCETATGIP